MAKPTQNTNHTKAPAPVAAATPAPQAPKLAPAVTGSAPQATAPSTQLKPAPQAAPAQQQSQKVEGPTHEQIARRAYEIYQARGADHGHHQDDWSQAERELRLGKQ